MALGGGKMKEKDIAVKQPKDVVVVTGGTGGIGHYLCEKYHELGHLVYALDIACLKPLSEGIVFKAVDLGDPKAIEAVFEQIYEASGPIQILINNGAVAHFTTALESLEMEALDHVLTVNLRGAICCCKEMVKRNVGASYGRIINIASTRALQNEENWEIYGATKGGLVALTHSLAVSLSGKAITVNAISPGWICCDEEAYQALTEEDHRQHPSGRVGRPEDIFKACHYLSDSENDFVNGTNLVVDGGMTKKMIYI